LPARISHLVVGYLRYVLPFLKMIDISESLLSNVFLFGDENKPWDTDRMTDMLRKVTGRQIGLKMTNRLYRHIAIAIDRQHIRPGMNDDDESGDCAAEDEASYAHDTMAAHSKRIADMRYARVNNLTGNLTPETMSIYREICDRSHTWLGMPSRDTKPVRLQGKERVSMTNEDKAKEIDRVMTELYGFNWKWKSEGQRDSVERTVAGVSPLFIILPTGGGKTLSFMVPTKMRNSGTTVVITPLIALGEDLVRRFTGANVDTVLYREDCPRRAKVIVAVTETARKDHFRQFVMELQLEGKLDRVVYDEAHKLVSDQSYRPYIAMTKDLRLRCQMLFVTGTCPEELVRDLTEEMVIPTPHVIRESYYKPAFIYSVQVCRNVARAVRERISSVSSNRDGDSKCLVFCRTRNDVRRYSKEYDGHMYISGASTNRSELNAWNGGLMFATSALGAGMDIERIEDILHVDLPYGMLDYVQESGRGGRGGETVHCAVIVSEKDYREYMEIPKESLTRDECALQAFLRGDVCRNKVITEYLNGAAGGRTCTECGGKLCDICSSKGEHRELKRRQDYEERDRLENLKRRRIYDAQAQLRQDAVRSMEETWDRIEMTLEQIGTGCMVCWYGREDYRQHQLKNCLRWKQIFPAMSPLQARGRIDFQKIRNSCWSCGFPGDRCADYRLRKRCIRKVHLFPVLLYYWQAREQGYYDVIKGTMRKEYEGIDGLAEALVASERVLDENGTMGFKVWIEMFRRRLALGGD